MRAACASEMNMQTWRCCCKYSSHAARDCPSFTASSQRRVHEWGEREPNDRDRTCGTTGRAASDVTKSSMAWPNPIPSSVDALVFVLDTSVETFRPVLTIRPSLWRLSTRDGAWRSPNDAIWRVSRLPSPLVAFKRFDTRKNEAKFGRQ